MALTSTKKRRDIGERLRSERERLGYTPEQIASLLGVPLEQYQRYETGELDPGVFRMTRLAAIDFDILYVITSERHTPINEENELLDRFRELSRHGKASVFMTLDALERLAPNLRRTIRKTLRSKK
ncbi:helix-turn-helix transcriptional regulator [Mesosutterella sp. OilRF-GAM-744-9]|uniref:Helix-turn-helix transcriptional regulator n=2 Tax=Mesosutterella TaxID=2494213 RepID=A0ABS9MNN2_9BURK|nr:MULTISPECIES: helix-turn-helix transcriptional regulator [unclassified Mesosutterella]MCG5030224.1 helix-turn-helix transcriptional regulator [Mesosutterella sp. oilRF-744-WT-GAM-9]MCI6529993.1 helix-turn-helix transcriptional regulator [Mesosutterella sp.]MDL2058916.1 helix-turn-helix transcriptional regulator [Mesosutterella sp. AGMB02718]